MLPLSFIAEEAGGLAIHDGGRIMDVQPTELHQRIPYYVGSKNLVEVMQDCQSS